jgi:hypothetical protein
MPKQVRVASTVIRHYPQFNRLVTIPLETIASWELEHTTVIEGTINGIDLGRRRLKRWDDRNCWWIDLPEPLCRKANLETGTTVELIIRLASEALPEELQNLLNQNAEAKERWEKLTNAQQRMLREEILSAKTTVTRMKRAEKWLLGR